MARSEDWWIPGAKFELLQWLFYNGSTLNIGVNIIPIIHSNININKKKLLCLYENLTVSVKKNVTLLVIIQCKINYQTPLHADCFSRCSQVYPVGVLPSKLNPVNNSKF